MTPEEFRAAGHELIDWIADLRSTVDDRPVKALVEPGDIKAQLPTAPPDELSGISDLIEDMNRVVVPGTTMVHHPMHFGWFPSNSALSSVLGDIASSGLGALGITWESAPALTEMEEVMCEWMRQLTGLSSVWKGTISDTASSSVMVAMLAARERASGHAQVEGGLADLDSPLTVYTTPQAHSSVRKAALLAGFGAKYIRQVDVDPWTRAMVPEHLAELISKDVEQGMTPAIVVAGCGTTGTTAFDPIDEIATVLSETVLDETASRVWLHVDAAMAGSAALLPEMRHLWDGVERSDSISWNPHKWMGTILDCSLLYFKDPDHVIRVMSTNPAYLRSEGSDEVTQYKDWGIPLGRRFRSLKLWFHLRLDGIEAIQERLRRDLGNAQWLAKQIDAEPGWELVAPVALQTVCVRHRPDDANGSPLRDAELDAHTLRWVNAINQSGKAFCTPSTLDDEWMVRISVGVENTERHHLERLWELMREQTQI